MKLVQLIGGENAEIGDQVWICARIASPQHGEKLQSLDTYEALAIVESKDSML